ncbi:MAG: hypothetical protein HUU29_10375 [Planctomycetaceae bacterium]|nr:hypothetical protein [Planctomycetaceae bacterium]
MKVLKETWMREVSGGKGLTLEDIANQGFSYKNVPLPMPHGYVTRRSV